MGAWSAEPFGNDSAGDWAWELDDAEDWDSVRAALTEVLDAKVPDEDVEIIAIAAAEVVAHGLGSPTQDDEYTESVSAFVSRVGRPDEDTCALARSALAKASAAGSAISELWDGDPEWTYANARIAAALGVSHENPRKSAGSR